MKQTFKIIIMLMVAIVTTQQTFAQNERKNKINREQLAKIQARHIADKLAFDETTTKNFVETYCQCQQEIWALGPRAGKGKKGKDMSETDEETGREIEARFEHSKKILDIRHKYYKKYSTFLTQQQIKRVYELERQMMNRLSGQKGKVHKRRRQMP